MLLGPPSITILVPRSQCSAFIWASLGIAWEQGGDEGDRAALLGGRSNIRFQAQKYPCQDLSTGTSGSQGFAVEHHVRSWSPAAPALTFWCHCSCSRTQRTRMGRRMDRTVCVLPSIAPS